MDKIKQLEELKNIIDEVGAYSLDVITYNEDTGAINKGGASDVFEFYDGGELLEDVRRVKTYEEARDFIRDYQRIQRDIKRLQDKIYELREAL